MTGKNGVEAEQGVAWVRDMCHDLGVCGISRWGMSKADIAGLVAKARAASSMRGNPIELTESELTAIAQKAL